MVLLAAPLFLSERSNGANSGVGGREGGGDVKRAKTKTCDQLAQACH